MRNFLLFVYDKLVTIFLYIGFVLGIIASYYFANLGYRFNFGIFILGIGINIIFMALMCGLLLIPLQIIELLSKNNELLKKIHINSKQDVTKDTQTNVIPAVRKTNLNNENKDSKKLVIKKDMEPFVGERNLLNNNSYRDYLIQKYKIDKNDETNNYEVGSNSYATLHRALEFAHDLDSKK